MKALVLHESLYGNTKTIASAVADGLRTRGAVTLARFDDPPAADVEAFELVVLGGPTHGWGMTKPDTRTRPGAGTYATGAREWLEASPRVEGKMAAVFDTRFAKPRWLTGSAAVRIARRLERVGYRVIVPPESFFVLHTEGPLREGEVDRARRWGEETARRAAAAV